MGLNINNITLPTQKLYWGVKDWLTLLRICRSCRDLHSPFKFVLSAAWNQKICLCLWRKSKFEISNKSLVYRFPFFSNLDMYYFWRFQVEVGHGHGRMGFGKSYYTDWGMGLKLRIWSMMSFLSLCLWICIYICSCAQNTCACIYIGYMYSYMYEHMYIYLYMYIYAYLYSYTYIHIHMYTYAFIHFFICMYVYIYLSVCAWIYLNSLITHVNTHTNTQTLLCVLQGFLTKNLARTVIWLLTHIFKNHSVAD